MRTAPAIQRARGASQLLPLAMLLLMGALPAGALERVQVELGNLSGDGWRAENVRLDMQLDGAASIEMTRLSLPPPVGAIQGLRLDCRRLDWSAQQLRCSQGQLHSASSPWGTGPMPISFSYRAATGAVSVDLRQARLAAGQADLNLQLQNGYWRLRLQGRKLNAEALAAQWPVPGLPQGLTVAATFDLELDTAGAGSAIQHARLRLVTEAAGFSSADGRHAAEDLALQLNLDATAAGADWRFDGTLLAGRGTVCAGPCWELPAEPLRVQYQGRWSGQGQRLTLKELRVQDAEVLQATASGSYAFADASPWQSFDVQLRSEDAQRLYQRYLQPLAIGTVLDDLEVAGALSAHIQGPDQQPLSVQCALKGLSIEDRQQRFGLRGLDGELNWQDGQGSRSSVLAWQSGNLYQIPIGASRVRLRTEAAAVRLAEPASIPVFDGRLELARFSLQQPGSDAMRWNVDAVLTPVAMQDFSRAMGWPEMAGRLSGVIPELQYADRRLTVDGVLLIRAFDGDITLRNLQAQNLLGVVPTLNADIQLRNIDLRQLTGTFSFGRIEGRLEGAMAGLELQNWRPVSFDARFATPVDDKSRHRISQRAVDNLTSLGGGVGGALSRSFLRFFDDFSYDRLGLSCKLHNGVCEMGGVAPAPQGYYIVKGGGLPRIDVIGYQRRVDWTVLIKRLATVTSGSGPVIR